MHGEARSANTDDAAVVWASKIENGTLTEDEADALDAWLAGNPDRLAALARARAESAVVQTISTSGRSEQAISRRRFLSMAFIAGVGGALVSGGLLYLSNRHRYATAIGKMGHVLLPDGSMAILNTDTEIALSFTETGRNVRLMRGEALFDVELDVLRLFSLEAGSLLVQTFGALYPRKIRDDHSSLGALIDYGRDIADPLTQDPSRAGFEARGTTFSARIKSADRVEAAVLEGAVEVRGFSPTPFEARALAANSMLTTSAGSGPDTLAIDTKSLENRLAWLRRVVVFDRGATIREAAEEFNRYNELRIVVIGPVKNRQLRGAFYIDRPVDFAMTLQRMTRARVEVGDQVVTIAE